MSSVFFALQKLLSFKRSHLLTFANLAKLKMLEEKVGSSLEYKGTGDHFLHMYSYVQISKRNTNFLSKIQTKGE